MTNTQDKNPKVVIALDFDSEQQVLDFIAPLSPETCRLKVGKELFTSCGSALVKKLVALKFDVFLDLKFHDIPNTVASAVVAAAEMGVWMVNVHASGGRAMMEETRKRLDTCEHKPLLIAVTVLTSMTDQQLQETGVNRSSAEQVLHLAKLAKSSGMDGVVCSAQEAKALKENCGSEFLLVTPGIRPTNAAKDDQHRIVTPAQAIKNGSDYLVIGRPITLASNPVEALAAINREL